MLDKTFEPAAVERRHYAAWERSGAFAADPDSNKRPYTIMMPPPNVTGQPAHGARADLHAAGHPHPLSAHARPRRAVAARHRSRRASRPRSSSPPARRGGRIDKRDLGRERVHRARLGMEGAVGRHDHPPAAPPRRLARLDARALHDGRGPLRRGAQGVRRALPRRADLPRQAAGQLGPGDAHGDLRPRGREAARPRARCGTSAIRSRASRAASIVVATTRPETMLGDTGVAVHPEDERFRRSGRQIGAPAAGRPAASRSSPTNTPTRRPAAARSRSPRRTTSTISRSAGGTGWR